MQENLVNKAVLYGVLSMALLFPSKDTVRALGSGEIKEAIEEMIRLNILHQGASEIAVESLSRYINQDEDVLLRQLRVEYTRLFIGAPKPAVSPYAGVWLAKKLSVEPVLFVNKEAMAVERFMAQCGVGRPENTNEPLDHIGSELEFLQYLCLVEAGLAQPSQGTEVPEDAYGEFYTKHFQDWAKRFALSVLKETEEPLFSVASQIVCALPEAPL